MRIREPGAEQLADLFGALSHPLRLAIVRLLMRRPMCVCRLAAALEVPQPTLSRNLAILRRAGIVEGRQHGQFVRYELREDFAGQSLEGVYELVRALVPGDYDEEAVNRKLAELGICQPPDEEAA